jgi:DNA-binding transcriptional regulator YiaG
MNLDAIVEEHAKLAAVRDEMARECYLTPQDLAKRYGVHVETVYRWNPPRTKIPGSRAVYFHPLDILAWEQRPG